ncbi:hypothetical protein V2I01_18580 [Micromonospora sp. BRA006-A]|nr:hypothetical protein [Micromonospora sp. BRA006-A]
MYADGDLPRRDWEFPAPLGVRPVLGEFTMADVVTVPSHLDIPEVCTYMTVNAAGTWQPGRRRPLWTSVAGRRRRSPSTWWCGRATSAGGWWPTGRTSTRSARRSRSRRSTGS